VQGRCKCKAAEGGYMLWLCRGCAEVVQSLCRGGSGR